MAAVAETNAHYGRVARDLTDNRVVPLLGAGVNLCERPETQHWEAGRTLPSGEELATHLADLFYYPEERRVDLLRVSQYAASMNGTGPLYAELRRVFRHDFEPTCVHRFFADLPRLVAPIRADDPPDEPHQLIVTTNYDDALERAFADVSVEVDVLWYIADGEERGMFWHRPPGAEARMIERPDEYEEISLDRRPAILKIHGAVDRDDSRRDSYVITEDHYIDYVTKSDLQQRLPPLVWQKLASSRFLFLGYSMQDWNLRVILHRIWGRQKLTYRSWAIQLHPSEVEQELWRERDVDVLDIPLDVYTRELRRRFENDP